MVGWWMCHLSSSAVVPGTFLLGKHLWQRAAWTDPATNPPFTCRGHVKGRDDARHRDVEEPVGCNQRSCCIPPVRYWMYARSWFCLLWGVFLCFFRVKNLNSRHGSRFLSWKPFTHIRDTTVPAWFHSHHLFLLVFPRSLVCIDASISQPPRTITQSGCNWTHTLPDPDPIEKRGQLGSAATPPLHHSIMLSTSSCPLRCGRAGLLINLRVSRTGRAKWTHPLVSGWPSDTEVHTSPFCSGLSHYFHQTNGTQVIQGSRNKAR